MSILPLDTWRNIVGYHPWHFWGWADNNIIPVTSSCNTILQKHAWQNADAAGRWDIQQALDQAEARLITYMRYAPAPHFITEEHQYPRYDDERVDRIGYIDGSGRWPAIQMNEGEIIKVGVRATTYIGEFAVVYTDDDGDGLNENWTVTLPTTYSYDLTQIKAFFAAADRLNGDDATEEWEIAPITVKTVGATTVIRGKSWLMAHPILYEGFDEIIIDPTEAANFVDVVDIYRVYCNPEGSTTDTSQAKLVWETRPHPFFCQCSACNPTPNNSTDPAAEGYALARMALRNAHLGLLGVGQATYNSASNQFAATINWQQCRPPDRIIVRAQAGKPLVNGAMGVRMQRVVAYFSTAELARPICACQEANRQLYHWQFDLARTGGADGEQYGAISSEDLNCPLGTRRGHVYAWKEIRDTRILTGIAY